MAIDKSTVKTVDEYLKGFPAGVGARLAKIRSVIRKVAPDAEELISYSMPGYKLNGMLVYFAGYENHIGLYGMPSAIKKFKEQLTNYKTSKGTIQFQHDERLPLRLIRDIVAFRVQENRDKKAKKA